MPVARVIALTALAMIAFAGNSLLCRAAFNDASIDAASFTTIRLASGTVMLWLITRLRRGNPSGTGNWISAFALFAYAAGFSFAYVNLSAATGALLLFGAVQATMISHGIWAGERLDKQQVTGLLLALCGLIGLLLPGLSSPPTFDSVLMLMAGIAWGVYSLRGRDSGNPLRVTAGNFLRALPFSAALGLLMLPGTHVDKAGFFYAITSGALASGIGYAIWYTALPAMQATHAATVQLSVPVITALGGVALLDENITLRLTITAIAILGGIALVIHERQSGDNEQISPTDQQNTRSL